jgi:hypothetical protein
MERKPIKTVCLNFVRLLFVLLGIMSFTSVLRHLFDFVADEKYVFTYTLHDFATDLAQAVIFAVCLPFLVYGSGIKRRGNSRLEKFREHSEPFLVYVGGLSFLFVSCHVLYSVINKDYTFTYSLVTAAVSLLFFVMGALLLGFIFRPGGGIKKKADGDEETGRPLL